MFLKRQTHSPNLHPPPDPRARARVPLQSLHNPSSSHRHRAHLKPIGAPNQDLVPESSHESEKGSACADHEPPIGLQRSQRTPICASYAATSIRRQLPTRHAPKQLQPTDDDALTARYAPWPGDAVQPSWSGYGKHAGHAQHQWTNNNASVLRSQRKSASDQLQTVDNEMQSFVCLVYGFSKVG